MGVLTIAGLLLVLSQGGSMVAAETIPAGEPIVMDKLVVEGDEDPSHLSGLVSREARRTIYANQPVTMDNTRPRRIVARNQREETGHDNQRPKSGHEKRSRSPVHRRTL